ncbi:ACL159Wp [Eremothecium gossypii ATCC 10895]|uniref:Dynactin subunit 4 n=1 Tax=Eremothecium gossypii (strain ATCC 10895 / CBS 109.51 / FGSC 9923 / NRRL Y-1056) TaxID=284811 RepID=Q75CS8_EREGS|nr:ACL159Wp [Eremothecium gossypii ATCC 10895]AAS51069.1 ACL159Wp [Eremothecium gossypii ATCC 10895]AEY95359.1 FACL159Wp [Eremothecium gossypii FDAG1]
MEVRYQCVCQQLVKWSDLNSCKECHSISCFRCQEFEPVLKYCPKCLEEPGKIDQIFCNRNCFQCPRCNISLVISSEKVTEDSKSYVFTCTGCKWSFTTPPTGKIKSLTKYVLELYNSKNSRAYELMTHLHNKKQLLQWEGRAFKFDEIVNALEGNAPRSFVQRLAAGEKLHHLINEELAQPLQQDMEHVLYPKRTHLKCRYRYMCPKCHHTLSMPDQTPASSKLHKESFAMNVLPHIRIETEARALGVDTQDPTALAIIVMNPIPMRAVDFVLSASDTLFLPVRKFTIPSVAPDDSQLDRSQGKDVNLQILEHYVKFIPTCMLGNDHKLNRAERTRRLGNRFQFQGSASPTPPNPVDYDIEEEARPLDQGDAWCILPLKLLRDGLHLLNVLVTIGDWQVNLNLHFKQHIATIT